MPDEARGTSRKAAVAFVRHWVDTLNYSAETLDSAPLRELSSSDCTACNDMIQTMDRLARRGGYVEGHEWTVGEIAPVSRESTAAQVQAQLSFAASQTVRATGGTPEPYPAGESVFTFSLDRQANQWVVVRVFGVSDE